MLRCLDCGETKGFYRDHCGVPCCEYCGEPNILAYDEQAQTLVRLPLGDNNA